MNGPVVINGEQYELVVLRVLSKDSYGRPENVEFLYEDQGMISLSEDRPNEFVTALLQEEVIRMRVGGHA